MSGVVPVIPGYHYSGMDVIDLSRVPSAELYEHCFITGNTGFLASSLRLQSFGGIPVPGHLEWQNGSLAIRLDTGLAGVSF